MHTLSLAQILPSHVVEQIVDQVAGSSRLWFDGVTNSSEEYAVLLMPLLSVCQDFRAAVIARYCKIHTLDLTRFLIHRSNNMTLWPKRLRGIGFPTHLHAQELDITLDTFSVYNGAALRELLREPHSDFSFPMVRSLKLTLTQATRKQRLLASVFTAEDVEPNIHSFVQRIRVMAPMTRRVCISLQSPAANEPEFAVQHFSSLVLQLHQLGNTIEHYYNHSPMRLEPPPTGICSLVHADWSADNSDLLMQLARHNAPTLQTLDINVVEAGNVCELFLNVDGSYVQYPCLRVLKIQQKSGWFSPQKPTFPGAIPFPALRCLSFNSGYLFGDDMPFRGNAETLEYLYLDLSPGLIGVLQGSRVFTHNSHPKLQCVRLGLASDRTQALFDTDIAYMAFVLSIGPNASERELDHLLAVPPFSPLIPALGEYACIQVLLMPLMSMDLWDAIALVKALPLLSDLYTGSAKMGSLPSGISKHKLPAYVIANYAPAGERFRCWRLKLYDVEFKIVAKCVLLLALVCPNFDYAAVPAENREVFMVNLKGIINSKAYIKHATRLRRLLFSGWKDEYPSAKALQ
ncbi:hypothetical protein IW146_000754 [Coemansia sp. RSA 922]|nr:hypothetical protein GGI08_001548 [Coemansia sp. S2]KAJ2117431.1 hypothetical protein IW146_000754 [Coemansia sp. RSA 922]KAJ2431675.1 hypothetical protein GGF41_000431 [Coemansia sp. RSA 2531]